MQDLQSLEQAKSFFISGLEKLNSYNLSGAEIDFESSLRFAPNRLSIIININAWSLTPVQSGNLPALQPYHWNLHKINMVQLIRRALR